MFRVYSGQAVLSSHGSPSPSRAPCFGGALGGAWRPRGVGGAGAQAALLQMGYLKKNGDGSLLYSEPPQFSPGHCPSSSCTELSQWGGVFSPHTQARLELSCAEGSAASFGTGWYRVGSLATVRQTRTRPGPRSLAVWLWTKSLTSPTVSSSLSSCCTEGIPGNKEKRPCKHRPPLPWLGHSGVHRK